MGFYTTTPMTEKPHPETPSCAQKTASGNFFTYPIKTQHKNRHNSLKTNQEKPLPTHETASGVFYYKFRHYSAELGRWPSRDPIEERGGVNLYGFAGNEPIRRWDRLGLMDVVYFCKCTERLSLGYYIEYTAYLLVNDKWTYKSDKAPKDYVGEAMGLTEQDARNKAIKNAQLKGKKAAKKLETITLLLALNEADFRQAELGGEIDGLDENINRKLQKKLGIPLIYRIIRPKCECDPNYCIDLIKREGRS